MWQTILSVVGALGGVTTLVTLVTLGPTIRRARADARRADIDATIAEDAGEIAHWRAMLQTQVELVVQPLREEVARLRVEVEAARADAAAARADVTQHRTRYWRAVTYIRALLGLLATHAPHATVPPPPAEISADI